MQHRSINQRLKRAKSPEAKAEAIAEWLSGWRREQNQLITALERAVSQDDYDNTCIALGQLKAVLDKKMVALPGVFAELLKSQNSI